MNLTNVCLWSVVIAVCVLGAPLLVCVIASANIAGLESEQERKRGE